MPNRPPILRSSRNFKPATLNDVERPSAAKRGYGRTWQKLRLMILRAEPLCRLCKSENRVTLATDVDHIVPLGRGGPNTSENLRPLCKAHHGQITREGNVR